MHWSLLVSSTFHLEASSLMFECVGGKKAQVSATKVQKLAPPPPLFHKPLCNHVYNRCSHRFSSPSLEADAGYRSRGSRTVQYVFPVRGLLQASAPCVDMMKGAPEQTSNQI